MTHQPLSFPPVVIERLVEGSPDERLQWLEQVAASFSAEALRELEHEALRDIERRYPDDPKSLFNLRYKRGLQCKAQVRALFDEAHLRQTSDQLQQIQRLQTLILDHRRAQMADGFAAERHPAVRQHRRDQLDQAVQALLAKDAELQRQLVLSDREHTRRLELGELEHTRAMAVQDKAADLELARRQREQPHELNLQLYTMLTTLLQYQMSLNDRAWRNPALADRLRMMGLGLTAVMSTVQGLINDLNEGGHPITVEQQRAQSEQLLTLAMEQMQQWHTETRQEPDL